MRDLSYEYAGVLRRFLGDAREEDLLAAYDLGKQFQVALISPDEVIGFHYEAIAALAPELPEQDRSHKILASFKVLVEVMIAYGLMHIEAAERVARDGRRQEQIERLEALDGMKDQFLGILSHELRTPINAIMGFSSMLADEVMGPLTPAQAPYVDKILASSETMLQLVSDLLDMSRVHAGKFSVDVAPMDFAGVTREALTTIEVLAKVKDQVLVDALPPGALPLAGDSLRVGQIVTNLLSNAIKFTPRGGTITVRARTERQMLLCEIEDNGIGILAEDLATVFATFTQVDMSNTRQAGGTGLGLSICRALVACHGGTIGVRSEPGQGSTFWFTLPLAGPESPAPELPADWGNRTTSDLS